MWNVNLLQQTYTLDAKKTDLEQKETPVNNPRRHNSSDRSVDGPQTTGISRFEEKSAPPTSVSTDYKNLLIKAVSGPRKNIT